MNCRFRAGCAGDEAEQIAEEIRQPGQPDFNLDYGCEQIIAALKERMGADFEAKLVRFGWYKDWRAEMRWLIRVSEHHYKNLDRVRNIQECLADENIPAEAHALEWFLIKLAEWLGPNVSLRMARAFILLSPTFEELVKLYDEDEQ
jgi:hypothetical protein